MIYLAAVGVFLIVFFVIRGMVRSTVVAVIIGSLKSLVFLFVARAAIQGSFKSDDLVYWIRSARFDQILEDWQFFLFEPELAWGGGNWGYFLVNWVARQVFLDSPIGPIFFNSLVGVVTGYFVYLIAKILTDNRKFSVISGAIFVVMPETLVWTSYNFKDSWVQMLTLGFLFMVIKAANSGTSSRMVMFSLFAVTIAVSVWPFRFYVPPVMIVSQGAWFLIVAGRSIRETVHQRLTGLFILLFGLIWMLTFVGFCPPAIGVRCHSEPDLASAQLVSNTQAVEKQGQRSVAPTVTPVSYRDPYQAPLGPRPTPIPSSKGNTQTVQTAVEVEKVVLDDQPDSNATSAKSIATPETLTNEPIVQQLAADEVAPAVNSETPATLATSSQEAALAASSEPTPEQYSGPQPRSEQFNDSSADRSQSRVSSPAPADAASLGETVSPSQFKGVAGYLWGMAKMTMTPRPWSIFDPYWPQLLPAALTNWLLLPFAIVGAYFLATRRRNNGFLFLYALLMMTVLAMFTNLIGPRQRFMLYPILFLSQAYGVKIAIDYYRSNAATLFNRYRLGWG